MPIDPRSSFTLKKKCPTGSRNPLCLALKNKEEAKEKKIKALEPDKPKPLPEPKPPRKPPKPDKPEEDQKEISPLPKPPSVLKPDKPEAPEPIPKPEPSKVPPPKPSLDDITIPSAEEQILKNFGKEDKVEHSHYIGAKPKILPPLQTLTADQILQARMVAGGYNLLTQSKDWKKQHNYTLDQTLDELSLQSPTDTYMAERLAGIENHQVLLDYTGEDYITYRDKASGTITTAWRGMEGSDPSPADRKHRSDTMWGRKTDTRYIKELTDQIKAEYGPDVNLRTVSYSNGAPKGLVMGEYGDVPHYSIDGLLGPKEFNKIAVRNKLSAPLTMARSNYPPLASGSMRTALQMAGGDYNVDTVKIQSQRFKIPGRNIIEQSSALVGTTMGESHNLSQFARESIPTTRTTKITQAARGAGIGLISGLGSGLLVKQTGLKEALGEGVIADQTELLATAGTAAVLQRGAEGLLAAEATPLASTILPFAVSYEAGEAASKGVDALVGDKLPTLPKEILRGGVAGGVGGGAFASTQVASAAAYSALTASSAPVVAAEGIELGLLAAEGGEIGEAVGLALAPATGGISVAGGIVLGLAAGAAIGFFSGLFSKKEPPKLPAYKQDITTSADGLPMTKIFTQQDIKKYMYHLPADDPMLVELLNATRQGRKIYLYQDEKGGDKKIAVQQTKEQIAQVISAYQKNPDVLKGYNPKRLQMLGFNPALAEGKVLVKNKDNKMETNVIEQKDGTFLPGTSHEFGNMKQAYKLAVLMNETHDPTQYFISNQYKNSKYYKRVGKFKSFQDVDQITTNYLLEEQDKKDQIQELEQIEEIDDNNLKSLNQTLRDQEKRLRELIDVEEVADAVDDQLIKALRENIRLLKAKITTVSEQEKEVKEEIKEEEEKERDPRELQAQMINIDQPEQTLRRGLEGFTPETDDRPPLFDDPETDEGEDGVEIPVELRAPNFDIPLLNPDTLPAFAGGLDIIKFYESQRKALNWQRPAGYQVQSGFNMNSSNGQTIDYVGADTYYHYQFAHSNNDPVARFFYDIAQGMLFRYKLDLANQQGKDLAHPFSSKNIVTAVEAFKELRPGLGDSFSFEVEGQEAALNTLTLTNKEILAGMQSVAESSFSSYYNKSTTGVLIRNLYNNKTALIRSQDLARWFNQMKTNLDVVSGETMTTNASLIKTDPSQIVQINDNQGNSFSFDLSTFEDDDLFELIAEKSPNFNVRGLINIVSMGEIYYLNGTTLTNFIETYRSQNYGITKGKPENGFNAFQSLDIQLDDSLTFIDLDDNKITLPVSRLSKNYFNQFLAMHTSIYPFTKMGNIYIKNTRNNKSTVIDVNDLNSFFFQISQRKSGQPPTSGVAVIEKIFVDNLLPQQINTNDDGSALMRQDPRYYAAYYTHIQKNDLLADYYYDLINLMEEYSNAIPADKMPAEPFGLRDFKIDLDGDQYYGLNDNGLQTLGGTNILKSNGLYKLQPDGNGYKAEVLMKTNITGADVNTIVDTGAPLLGQDPFYYALYFAKIAGGPPPPSYVNYYLHVLDLMANYMSGSVTNITAQDLPPRPPGLKDYGMNLTLTPMTQKDVLGNIAYGNLTASKLKSQQFVAEGLDKKYEQQLLSTQAMLIKSKIANNMSKGNVRLSYDGTMLNNQTAVYYAAYFQHVDYQPDLVNFFLYFIDQNSQSGSSSILQSGESSFIEGGFLPINFVMKEDPNQAQTFLNGINTSLAGQYSVGNYQTNNITEKLDATQISDIETDIGTGYIYTDSNYVNFEYVAYESFETDTWKYYPGRIVTTNATGNQIVRLPRSYFNYSQLITWDTATSNRDTAMGDVGATYFTDQTDVPIYILPTRGTYAGPSNPHLYFQRGNDPFTSAGEIDYSKVPLTDPNSPLPEDAYKYGYSINQDNPNDPVNIPLTIPTS